MFLSSISDSTPLAEPYTSDRSISLFSSNSSFSGTISLPSGILAKVLTSGSNTGASTGTSSEIAGATFNASLCNVRKLLPFNLILCGLLISVPSFSLLSTIVKLYIIKPP